MNLSWFLRDNSILIQRIDTAKLRSRFPYFILRVKLCVDLNAQLLKHIVIEGEGRYKERTTLPWQSSTRNLIAFRVTIENLCKLCIKVLKAHSEVTKEMTSSPSFKRVIEDNQRNIDRLTNKLAVVLNCLRGSDWIESISISTSLDPFIHILWHFSFLFVSDMSNFLFHIF